MFEYVNWLCVDWGVLKAKDTISEKKTNTHPRQALPRHHKDSSDVERLSSAQRGTGRDLLAMWWNWKYNLFYLITELIDR